MDLTDPPTHNNSEDSFIPTRTSLLLKIKDWQDKQSWQAFYAMYRKMVFRIARKSGLDAHAAEEVMQDTMLTVATSIDRYVYEPKVCSFKAWLLRITRCRIVDYFRKKQRRIPSATLDGVSPEFKPESIEDQQTAILPDTEWDVEWQEGLMDAAIEKIRLKVSPEQFQIFDFYVIKKWPANKVATTLNINIAQVYLAKYRVSSQLKKEMLHLSEKWG